MVCIDTHGTRGRRQVDMVHGHLFKVVLQVILEYALHRGTKAGVIDLRREAWQM